MEVLAIDAEEPGLGGHAAGLSEPIADGTQLHGRPAHRSMIFQLKHRWQSALVATLLLGGLAWYGWGWQTLWRCPLPIGTQILLGLLVGLASLAVDGLLHTLLSRRFSPGYAPLFRSHGVAVSGAMGPAEIVTGGLMAGLGEEPFFRGLLLPALAVSTGHTGLAVAITSLLFASCHWLSPRFFGFWIWACWEGMLFGVVFVMTESLLVVMLAHALHDWVGYAVFRWKYRLHEGEAGA